MLVNIFDGVWNSGYLVDGGRNLFKHSSLIGEKLLCDYINMCNSVTSAKYEDIGIHLVTPSDGNANNGIQFVIFDYTSLGLKRGDTITFSADIKGTSDNHTPFITIWLPSKSNKEWWTGSKSIDTNFTPTDTFQRVKNTFTIPASTETLIEGSICFGIHGNHQSDLYIRNVKLERGTTPTDWTPAPEDTFELGTAHPDSIFTSTIPVKKNTQYVYGLSNKNNLPTHTIRYMKSDGTWVKAVNVDEDNIGGLKTLTFDDDYNIEIMFQNGLSTEQKANFKFKEENNMAIKATAQATIIDITDAYSVMLTSEAYTFVGGTGGVGAGQTCVTEAVAYCGSNQCASVSVNAADITCPTGITATVENSGTSKVKITFKTTATVNAACEATIPVVVDGITMNKKFSFAVARTGNTGATGKGIKGTPVAEYVGSTSNTTVPTSGWSTTIPSVTQGQYLWTRVTTTYTDNTTSVSYSVAKQGSTGATGTQGSQWYSGTGITGTSTTATVFSGSGVANARVNDMFLNTSTGLTYKCTVAGNASTAKWVYAGSIKGAQGDKGNTGATGNGISKADITYAASSSNTSAPSSGWQSTPPSVSAGQYLWTKTVFTYTNGGTATQYSVAKQGATGAAGADALTGTITFSNGNIFKNNTGSTVLTAHVWKGSVEQTITDAGACGSLGSVKWYKTGSDTAIATAKSITVSADDVTNTASYYFQLEG